MKPKFKVGQTVQLSTNGLGRTTRGTSYEIISIRPANDDEFQYVIKSPAEAYQRCVREGAGRVKAATQRIVSATRSFKPAEGAPQTFPDNERDFRRPALWNGRFGVVDRQGCEQFNSAAADFDPVLTTSAATGAHRALYDTSRSRP